MRSHWPPSLGWLASLLLAPLAFAQVQLGSEVLATNAFHELRGKRVGLLTNPSGVNRSLQSTVDVFHKSSSVKLVALFAAEHGIHGDIPAGTEFKDTTDPATQLPVFSLYGPGPTRKPTQRMLQDIDVLVYDIQDTGCRSYTFISTMEACSVAGVAFMVLDRPNPLGGNRVEGSLLNPAFRSHVGQFKIPYAYGMTSGELARMLVGEGWVPRSTKLTVIPMKGWRRSMAWRDTGLPWIPTSPYIPHADSPLHYVSTGILGQIGGVSIGIGYTLPFQCIAAPWLDAEKFADQMNSYKLPGVRFLPVRYRPFYGAHNSKLNAGVQIHFTRAAEAPLMAINLYALDAIRKLTGRNLVRESTLNSTGAPFFDKVAGGETLRKQLLAGIPAEKIQASWRTEETSFKTLRQKYLLY